MLLHHLAQVMLPWGSHYPAVIPELKSKKGSIYHGPPSRHTSLHPRTASLWCWEGRPCRKPIDSLGKKLDRISKMIRFWSCKTRSAHKPKPDRTLRIWTLIECYTFYPTIHPDHCLRLNALQACSIVPWRKKNVCTEQPRKSQNWQKLLVYKNNSVLVWNITMTMKSSFHSKKILLSRARLQDVSFTWFSSNSLAWIVLNWQSALHFKTQPRFCRYLSDNLNFRGSQVLLLSASSSWVPAEGS